uniref:EGF-like domain-containing protein n=1 Tax=Lutzomyia longipalpis TaxID=7200 RepID=A0A1B0CC30_LUTLO
MTLTAHRTEIVNALYGESCEEGTQCSHMLTGATCRNNVCTCEGDEFEMRTYTKGRCRKLLPLHAECDEDLDCDFGFDRESVVCKSGTCQCADGFYHRGENICRRISMNVGDDCIVNSDCQGGNHECISRRCEETSETSERKEVEVQTDFIDSPASFTEFENATTESTSNSYRQLLGDPCVNNGEPCQGLAYSTCIKDRCHCKLGYYPRNGFCTAELGEEAASSDHCANIVRNNKCVCAYDSFYQLNMRSCIRNVLALNASCAQQSQCSPFLSMCDNGPLIRRCSCHPFKIYDQTSQMCVLRQGLGEFCEKKEDCTLSNTACQPDNTCACDDGYMEMDGQCKPVIGGSCETTEDCAVDETECVTDSADKEDETAGEEEKKVCRCKVGFTHHIKNECLPIASKYKDECKENEQCQPLLGPLGKCIDEECACDEENHYKDEKCNEKIVLGEKCSKSSECFVTDNSTQVECRNDICQCEYGYYSDTTRIKCVKSSNKNSSGRPSPLKIITMLLITAAFLVTSAAIKEAYY